MRGFLKKVAIYITLAVIVVLAVFPFLWMFISSLKSLDDIFNPDRLFIFTPTLANYSRLFEFSTFSRDLINSVIISSISVLIAMVVGICAGYALSRYKIRHRDDFLFFVLTTRMGPAVTFALPFYMLYRKFNLLDTYTGMFIIYTLFNLAFAVWMSKVFFDAVPRECEDAAMVDGCSDFGAFTKVAIPLALQGLVVVALLCFIFTWNEFFYSMVLTRTVARTFPVSLMQFVGAPRIKWELLFTASTIGCIVPVVISIILRDYLITGLTFGMVKMEK